MKKHDISNYHRHDRLISCSTESTDHSSTNKTGIACRKSLPDISKNTDQPADKACGAPSEDVTKGNDDEIRIAKRDGCCSKLVVLLVDILVGLREVRTSILTCGSVLWNSWIKIGVSGAIASGVKILMKTKMAWLMITIAFQVGLQFFGGQLLN